MNMCLVSKWLLSTRFCMQSLFNPRHSRQTPVLPSVTLRVTISQFQICYTYLVLQFPSFKSVTLVLQFLNFIFVTLTLCYNFSILNRFSLFKSEVSFLYKKLYITRNIYMNGSNFITNYYYRNSELHHW